MKTQKILTFLLFYFISIFYLKAQKWELGAVGGAGIVSTRTPYLSYPKDFKGFGAGLSLKYQITKRIAVLANLFYEEKNQWIAADELEEGGQVIHRPPYQDIFQHISLPIILNCSFGKKTKFFMNAGMYFNYLIKQDLKMNATTYGGSYGQWIITDVTGPKRFDTGAIIGIGVSQPLSNILTLSLEVRNCSGLYNIAMPSASTKYYMNYQSLLLGISCKFGKAK